MKDALAIGSVFVKYEILEEIARGGMGVVYRAREIFSKREVALKVLLHGPFSEQTDIQRFFREAQTASALNHPNIVRVHTVGEHEGYYYLVMDYIKGKTLHEVIEEEPSKEFMIQVMAKIARALFYAHKQKIIHRDIKASNILIDEEGEPFLSDFGLAKQMAMDQTITQTGTTLGTPYYMSPEQVRGRKDMDHRSDIYSLGVLLYESLVQRFPFEAETLSSLYEQILTAKPVPLEKIDPTIPRYLNQICCQAMARDREKRYDNAFLFARALEKYLRFYQQPQATSSRWQKKSLWGIGVGILLLLLVVFFPFGSKRIDNPLTVYQTAHTLQQQQQFTAALEKLDELLANYPHYLPAYQLRIQILQQTQDQEKLAAEQQRLERVLAKQNKHLNLVQRKLSQKEWASALSHLASLENKFGYSPHNYFFKSLAYQGLEKWPEAFACISQAVEGRSSFDYYLQKAEIALLAGYQQEAEQSLEQAQEFPAAKESFSFHKMHLRYFLSINDYDKGYRLAQQLAHNASYTIDEPLQFLWGKAAFFLEKYLQAEKLLSAVINSSGLPSSQKSEALLYRGILRRTLNQPQQAIADLSKLSLKEFPQAGVYLGACYLDLNQPKKSHRYLIQASQKIANFPLLHECLAKYYLSQSHYQQAEEQVQQCIKLVPWQARYRHLYGQILLAEKRFSEAEKPLERALELHPGEIAPLGDLLKAKIEQGGVAKILEFPIVYQAYLVRFYFAGEPSDLFRDQYNILKKQYQPEITNRRQRDFRSLVQLLEDSQSPNIREIALEGLATFYDNQEFLAMLEQRLHQSKVGKEETFELWKKLQQRVKVRIHEARKQKIRRLIVRLFLGKDLQALQELDNWQQQGEQLLQEILSSPAENTIVRLLACRTLLSLGSPSAFKMVENFFHNSAHREIRTLCAVAMKEKNLPVEQQVLLAGTQSPEPFLRALCTLQIEDTDKLLALLEDNDERVRVYAAARLLEIQPHEQQPRCHTTLAQACQSENPFVRIYSCAKLWPKKMPRSEITSSPEFIEKYQFTLKKLLQDPHPLVQRAAALRVGSYKIQNLTQFLPALTNSPDLSVRLQAYTSLAWNRKHNELLAQALLNPNENLLLRVAAANGLLLMRDFSRVKDVSRLLQEEQPHAGIFAICFLGTLKGDLGARLILPYLQHSDPRVKATAATVLMLRSSPFYIPKLEKLLADPSPFVREAAVASLLRCFLKGYLQGGNSLEHFASAFWEAFPSLEQGDETVKRAMAWGYHFEIYSRTLTALFGTELDPKILRQYNVLHDRGVHNFLYRVYFYKNYQQHIEDLGTQKFYLWSLDQAIQSFAQANFLFERGLIYQHQGRKEKAIEDFKKALALSPNRGIFYHELIRTYYTDQQYQQVIATTKKVLQQNPRSLFAWKYLHRASKALSLKDQAEKAYQKVFLLRKILPGEEE